MSNGTPAFPIVFTDEGGGGYHSGLTKREYAAIQIMAGMSVGSAPIDKLVYEAVKIVDALFFELAK